MSRKNRAVELVAENNLTGVVYPLYVSREYLRGSKETEIYMDNKLNVIGDYFENELKVIFPSASLRDLKSKAIFTGWLVLSLGERSPESEKETLDLARKINSANGGIFREIPDFINFVREAPTRVLPLSRIVRTETKDEGHIPGVAPLFRAEYSHKTQNYAEKRPAIFSSVNAYSIALVAPVIDLPKKQILINLDNCKELTIRVAAQESCWEKCPRIGCEALPAAGLLPLETIFKVPTGEVGFLDEQLSKIEKSIRSTTHGVVKQAPGYSIVNPRNLNPRITSIRECIADQATELLSLINNKTLNRDILNTAEANSRRSKAAAESVKFAKDKCSTCKIDVKTCKTRSKCSGPFTEDPESILSKFRSYILASGLPPEGPNKVIETIQNFILSKIAGTTGLLGPFSRYVYSWPMLTYIPNTLAPPPLFICDNKFGRNTYRTLLSAVPKWENDKPIQSWPRWRVNEIPGGFSHKLRGWARGKLGFRTTADYSLVVNGEDLSNYYFMAPTKYDYQVIVMSLGYAAHYLPKFEALLANLDRAPKPFIGYSELDKLILKLTMVPSIYGGGRSRWNTLTSFAHYIYYAAHYFHYSRPDLVSRDFADRDHRKSIGMKYLELTGLVRGSYALMQASVQKGHICMMVPPMQTPHIRNHNLYKKAVQAWPTLF